MYKIKIRMESGETFFVKLTTHYRTPEQIQWLRDNMAFSLANDSYQSYDRVKTLEEATRMNFSEMMEIVPGLDVLYVFDSLEIIRSDGV